MTQAPQRRPLPAIIALAALVLLTALVWWRVLHRDSGSAKASPTCTPTSSAQVLPKPATVTLSVLNSTQTAGLAKKTATALGKAGFKVSAVGNDTGHAAVAGVAEIRFTPDQRAAATLLDYYVPHAALIPLPDTYQSQLVLAVGAKFKAVTATATVNAQLAAAHVTLGAAATSSVSSSC